MTDRPAGPNGGRGPGPAIVAAAVVAAVALVAITTLTVLGGGRGGPGPRPVGPRPEDPDGFLQAWARSRTATYRLEGTVTRRRGGDELERPVVVVERPPDHLRIEGDSIEQRLGDRVTTCATAEGAERTCTTRDVPAPAVDAVAAEQVAAMRALVAGPGSRYRVVADGPRCWSLGLLGDDPADALGTESRFCFDADTGAVARRRTRSGGVEEELRAERITGVVTDADLRLPQP